MIQPMLTNWNDLMEAYHSNDPDKIQLAKDSAVNNLEKFIWDKMWTWYPSYVDIYKRELFNQAVVGVMEGLQTFDIKKGKPTTHFAFHIKHEMHCFISEFIQDATGYYIKHIGTVKKCIEKFEAEGIPYNPESIAAATGLPLETVVNCLAIKQGTESTVAYDSEEYTTAKGSQQISMSAEDAFFEARTTETLEEALSQLDETTAQIIGLTIPRWYTAEEREAILGFSPKGDKATKKELAKAFHLSEAEITSRIRKGLTRLRKILNPVKKPDKVLNKSNIVIAPKHINLDDIDIF